MRFGNCQLRDPRPAIPRLRSHCATRAGSRRLVAGWMREARCSQGRVPWQAERQSRHPQRAVPSGCHEMRRLLRLAPRHRSTHYDLRRESRNHPHFVRQRDPRGLRRGSLMDFRFELIISSLRRPAAAQSRRQCSNVLNHDRRRLVQCSSAPTNGGKPRLPPRRSGAALSCCPEQHRSPRYDPTPLVRGAQTAPT